MSKPWFLKIALESGPSELRDKINQVMSKGSSQTVEHYVEESGSSTGAVMATPIASLSSQRTESAKL